MKPSIVLLVMVAGCSSGPPPEPVAGCNALVGDDCLSPFPSSLYEVADATASTGVRVTIPPGVLPVSSGGVALKTDRLNQRDGFSPSSPFLVYFKAGVSAAQLPGLDALAQTVTPDAPVQIFDYQTGTRLPVFAELDANAQQGDRQALIIRPMVRLAAGTRYVVALVGLTDGAGKPLVARGFAALRDKAPLSKALTALQPRTEEVLAALAKAGVARKSVTLAWDVYTASDETQTAHLVAMRDLALPMVDSLTWTVTTSTDSAADPDRLREVVGTFQVPTFLSDDTLTGTIALGANGQLPAPRLGSANFVIDIPQCAIQRAANNQTLPIIVFGHGLFGDAQSELASGYEKQVGNTLCMVQIGTDWIGLSSADIPTVSTKVVPDFNNITIVTDRLQQSHVNAQVLTRLFLKHLKNDPALLVNGKSIVGSEVYYYGISDGGIQGGTYMALSQDVIRGVLNVPGCEWNLMMFRSADFSGLKPILNGVFPDLVDQQVGLVLIQHEFDYSDPASFAPHIITAPFANTPAKRLLIQEAINDAQVANIATRVLVRTVGVPGLDLEQPVYGVTQMPAPLPSAYTQWDVTPMPVPPSGNVSLLKDNQAHEAVRRLPMLVQQLAAFFKPDGQVTQTCPGPCVFPTP